MNRKIAQTADGATVLRPGRHCRMLVIVQGETDVGALRACLASLGFERKTLGVSLPDAWPKEAPPDWPDEGIYALAKAQSLIRISGVFLAPEPVRVPIEVEIEPGAMLRVLETWDYGEADRKSLRTGAAASQSSSSSTASHAAGDDKGRKILIGAAVVGVVAAGWHWLSGRKKLEGEQERWEHLAEKVEREEITKRVQELTRSGVDRHDALAMAESEAERRPEAPGDRGEPRILVIRG